MCGRFFGSLLLALPGAQAAGDCRVDRTGALHLVAAVTEPSPRSRHCRSAFSIRSCFRSLHQLPSSARAPRYSRRRDCCAPRLSAGRCRHRRGARGGCNRAARGVRGACRRVRLIAWFAVARRQDSKFDHCAGTDTRLTPAATGTAECPWGLPDVAPCAKAPPARPSSTTCMPAAFSLLCRPYGLHWMSVKCLRQSSVAQPRSGSCSISRRMTKPTDARSLPRSGLRKARCRELRKLESGNVLVSRLAGRARLYTWNPRNPLVPALRSLFQSALRLFRRATSRNTFARAGVLGGAVKHCDRHQRFDDDRGIGRVGFRSTLACRDHGVYCPEGGAVQIYTSGMYVSRDLDFVSPASVRELSAAVRALGFERTGGRHFVHPECRFTLEFPPWPLAVGSQLVREWRAKGDIRRHSDAESHTVRHGSPCRVLLLEGPPGTRSGRGSCPHTRR